MTNRLYSQDSILQESGRSHIYHMWIDFSVDTVIFRGDYHISPFFVLLFYLVDFTTQFNIVGVWADLLTQGQPQPVAIACLSATIIVISHHKSNGGWRVPITRNYCSTNHVAHLGPTFSFPASARADRHTTYDRSPIEQQHSCRQSCYSLCSVWRNVSIITL